VFTCEKCPKSSKQGKRMITTIVRVLENIFEWIITGLGKASHHEFIVSEGGIIKTVEVYTIRESTITSINYLPKETFLPPRKK